MVRFKAWWEGLEPEAVVKRDTSAESGGAGTASSASAIEVDVPTEDDGPQLDWPESRLSFCRRLWGEEWDVVRPGRAEYSVQLVRPMALNNQNSLLDVSAGLGGGTRQIHKELGVWVTGQDREPELAEHGNAISNRTGLGRQAPISAFDPETVAYKPQSFDGALLREMLFELPSRDAFLEKVADAVRPFGHIVLTDLMLKDEEAASNGSVRAWLSREPEGASPAVVGSYTPILEELGFDVRVEEDETEVYMSHVLRGWGAFVQGLSKEDLSRDFVSRMMIEAEFWLYRMRVLESGQVRFYRYHAIKNADA